jgi:hypothetical protein
MPLLASRSGVIETDQRLSERRSSRAGTAPLEREPYVQVMVQTADTGFTAEEEAFFAEGDQLGLDDDDLLV